MRHQPVQGRKTPAPFRRAVTGSDYRSSYLRLQDQLLREQGLVARSSDVDLAGIGRVHLLEAGVGEPVVFLHGGGGIGAEHIAVAARLASRFRVILPDRPGHGLSDEFDYRRDLVKANVDFVRALLDALGVQRAALVGNSYGGFMALCSALTHPTRVLRLVHLSFSPCLTRRLPLMMRLTVAPVLGPLLGATVGRPSVRSTRFFFSKLIVAHIERMPAALIELEALHGRRHRHSTASLFKEGFTTRGFRPRYVLLSELPRVRVPTSFLWAEHDAFMTVEEGRPIARLVPGARFDVIPGAGHLPSWDEPEATARLIERELDVGKSGVETQLTVGVAQEKTP